MIIKLILVAVFAASLFTGLAAWGPRFTRRFDRLFIALAILFVGDSMMGFTGITPTYLLTDVMLTVIAGILIGFIFSPYTRRTWR